MKVIRRKINTAGRLLKHRGPMSTMRHMFDRLFEDRWFIGRLVEIAGNRGSLDGARFDLSSPLIATRLKSRFLLKSYEREARHLIRRYMPRNLPLIEFGGGMGVISCLSNRLLEHPELHVVVEANPDLIPVIQANKTRNDCRFGIQSGAVAYGVKEVDFFTGSRFNEGNLFDKSSSVKHVGAVSLESLLEKFGFERVSVVCDIEGSEMEMIEREGKILSERVESLIMETHGIDRSIRGQEMLADLGFTLVERYSNNDAYLNTRFAGDTVAAGPAAAQSYHAAREPFRPAQRTAAAGPNSV